MIDWGGGFFLGLGFGIMLIVIAIEFYFCVFDRYIEGDIERKEFIILLSITGLCLVLPAIQLKNFSLGFWPVIPVPFFYFLFRILENRDVEKTHKRTIDSRIRNLKIKLARYPDTPEIYIELGDIYFNKKDYRRALFYYKKAEGIKESPELTHKIKIAEREWQIQKGEIWICGQCGTTNSGNADECIKCGNSNKPLLSIKQDLIKNKEEIKRWVVKGFTIPFAGILLIILLKTLLPQTAFLFVAIFISLLVMYLLLRSFFTW